MGWAQSTWSIAENSGGWQHCAEIRSFPSRWRKRLLPTGKWTRKFWTRRAAFWTGLRKKQQGNARPTTGVFGWNCGRRGKPDLYSYFSNSTVPEPLALSQVSGHTYCAAAPALIHCNLVL